MTRRRRVHNNVRVLPFPVQLAQLEKRHHFIKPRQRKTQQLVDVLFVEQSSSRRDLRQHLPIGRTKPLECKTRVHFVRKESRPAKLFHFDQPVTYFGIKTVRERVRGISRKQKDGFVSFELVEEIESRSRRGSRLADATFATKEKVTRVQPLSRGSSNPPCSSPPTSMTNLEDSAVCAVASCIRSSCRILITRRRANNSASR